MDKQVTIEGKKRSSGVERSICWLCQSVSTDSTRPFMQGPLFHYTEDLSGFRGVIGAATDGRRVHWARFTEEQLAPYGIYIAPDAPSEYKPNQIVKRGKTRVDFTGVIDARFPNYQRVMPNYPDHAVLRHYDGFNSAGWLLQSTMRALHIAGVDLPVFNPEFIEQIPAYGTVWDNVYYTTEDNLSPGFNQPRKARDRAYYFTGKSDEVSHESPHIPLVAVVMPLNLDS